MPSMCANSANRGGRMRPFLTLHDPSIAQTHYNAGLWQADTFYTLLAKHADRRPDSAALRDGRCMLNWRTLKARVDAFADDLVERKFVAGDRLSIWMSPRPTSSRPAAWKRLPFPPAR